MLNKKHKILFIANSNNNNIYFLGKIKSHNIMITYFPYKNINIRTVAIITKNILHSFKFIKFGLIIDIKEEISHTNIRLGDVVISFYLYESVIII
jgi:hypothetical protein